VAPRPPLPGAVRRGKKKKKKVFPPGKGKETRYANFETPEWAKSPSKERTGWRKEGEKKGDLLPAGGKGGRERRRGNNPLIFQEKKGKGEHTFRSREEET